MWCSTVVVQHILYLLSTQLRSDDVQQLARQLVVARRHLLLAVVAQEADRSLEVGLDYCKDQLRCTHATYLLERDCAPSTY